MEEEIIQPVSKELLRAELTPEKQLRMTNKSNNEIFVITAHDSPNVMREVGRLRELAFKGLNDLAADGPTAEEFDMAKKNLQKNLPEDKVKNSWWLSAFVAYETMGNDRVANLEPAIERLTPEAVQNAAKAILDGTRVEIVMRPGVTAEVE